jgi:hypothetical protein
LGGIKIDEKPVVSWKTINVEISSLGCTALNLNSKKDVLKKQQLWFAIIGQLQLLDSPHESLPS